jgi:hypothetical protein
LERGTYFIKRGLNPSLAPAFRVLASFSRRIRGRFCLPRVPLYVRLLPFKCLLSASGEEARRKGRLSSPFVKGGFYPSLPLSVYEERESEEERSDDINSLLVAGFYYTVIVEGYG